MSSLGEEGEWGQNPSSAGLSLKDLQDMLGTAPTEDDPKESFRHSVYVDTDDEDDEDDDGDSTSDSTGEDGEDQSDADTEYIDSDSNRDDEGREVSKVHREYMNLSPPKIIDHSLRV